MFDNPRYITRGFQDRIPIPTQLLLFQMIDSAEKKEKLDYLQVFILSVEVQNEKTFQKIVHSQEQPPRSRTFLFPTNNPVTVKVFAIDDEDHHTFLLAEEY